ncbi:hypothetical protein SAMN02982989_3295 [Xaviernesmea oryzae]|uniref:Arylsulfatase n=1 Tax=Xaviernesmea oryzae TaxID=464029 RepID=A0A1X7E0Z4_9HYPH|nr:aspartate/glutamate racemase family protein [Xaviernesmea oryzae]SMF25465.1 hypothetical protein SAMN02982989_3295 [Xaviernesmea oryzae]
MSKSPRIVLLHATPVAMEPIKSSMSRLWPDAEAVNLLDDGLTIDRSQEGPAISERLTERFVDLGRYAYRMGANGILITCSAFGPAIDRMAAELPIPVLKPNEAMFRMALQAGKKIGMLATFGPAVPTMEDEFGEFAAEVGVDATLQTIVVADAIDILRRGDGDTHNRLVAARASEFAEHDALMLAHFSTSRASDAVRAVVGIPVLSAPDAAVERMKKLVSGE